MDATHIAFGLFPWVQRRPFRHIAPAREQSHPGPVRPALESSMFMARPPNGCSRRPRPANGHCTAWARRRYLLHVQLGARLGWRSSIPPRAVKATQPIEGLACGSCGSTPLAGRSRYKKPPRRLPSFCPPADGLGRQTANTRCCVFGIKAPLPYFRTRRATLPGSVPHSAIPPRLITLGRDAPLRVATAPPLHVTPSAATDETLAWARQLLPILSVPRALGQTKPCVACPRASHKLICGAALPQRVLDTGSSSPPPPCPWASWPATSCAAKALAFSHAQLGLELADVTSQAPARR